MEKAISKVRSAGWWLRRPRGRRVGLHKVGDKVLYKRDDKAKFQKILTLYDKLDTNGNPRRHKCQFSWYCDGKSDIPRNQEAWDRSQKFASDMYNFGAYIGITEGATHYHATYVKPSWAPGFDRITRIGSHYFYRMK